MRRTTTALSAILLTTCLASPALAEPGVKLPPRKIAPELLAPISHADLGAALATPTDDTLLKELSGEPLFGAKQVSIRGIGPDPNRLPALGDLGLERLEDL
jgi:hypothetical protein